MLRARVAAGVLLAVGAAGSQALAAPAAGTAHVDRFSIRFDGRVEHDTNITGVSESEAAFRGMVPEDTVYTPSLLVNLNLPVGRELVYLSGRAGYAYHENNTLLDSEILKFDGGVKGRVGMCAVTLEANYQRSLSSFEDVVLAPTVTNELEVEHVGAHTECARKTGLGFVASIGGDWADNSQTLLRPQDYEQQSYMAGVSYSRPRLGTLTLFGSHQHTDYIHRVAAAGQPDSFDVDSAGLSYDRRLGARIEGSASVSYTKVDQQAPATSTLTSSKFDGFTYSANLSYRPRTRMRIEGAFSREVTPSNRFGNSYDLSTLYRVKASYDLSNRLHLNLGGERREVDSRGAQVFAGNLTNSRVNTIFGGASYDLSRRITLGIDAAQEERKTNNARFDFDNTRVGVFVGATY